jgi:hypothetical protein
LFYLKACGLYPQIYAIQADISIIPYTVSPGEGEEGGFDDGIREASSKSDVLSELRPFQKWNSCRQEIRDGIFKIFSCRQEIVPDFT